MDPIHLLTTLEDRFLANHAAQGRSLATRKRYQATFSLFRRYLASAGTAPTSKALTSECLQGFAMWLRATPIKPQRGTTVRAESGIHAHLRDMRAFIR
jgi:hypothetical protein